MKRWAGASSSLFWTHSFQELEHEILRNPGAIEPWLIRRRRGEA